MKEKLTVKILINEKKSFVVMATDDKRPKPFRSFVIERKNNKWLDQWLEEMEKSYKEVVYL